MSRLTECAEMQITFASGVLRVEAQPLRNLFLLLGEAAAILLIAFWTSRHWPALSLFSRAMMLLLLLSAAAGWFEQLTGASEVVEFDAEHLRIRKKTFGWERVKEYPIQKCSDLELRKYDENRRGLQCRLGWRTVEFGDYLSEEQAAEVLNALADSLPALVPTLFPSTDITTHFTRLNLS